MKIKKIPPGSFGFPVLGETLSFFVDRDFAKNRYRQHGNIFKTHLFGRPTVVMVGPEALEFVLSSHIENFSWREGWPAKFKILLGESLFLQDGEEHRRNRRFMMPALHGPALADYLTTMEDMTRSHLQKWEKQQEFTWFPEFKQLTFDIASQLLLGTSPGPEGVRLSQLFTTLASGLFAFNSLQLPFTKFGKAVAARNQILEHVTKVVRERQQNPTKDVLSLLVQA